MSSQLFKTQFSGFVVDALLITIVNENMVPERLTLLRNVPHSLRY